LTNRKRQRLVGYHLLLKHLLIENAAQLGLVIEDDFILIPTSTKEQKSLGLYVKKREQVVSRILDKRTYRYDTSLSLNMSTDTFTNIANAFNKTLVGSIFGVTSTTLRIIAHNIKLRTVIIPFVGEIIDVKESQARPYLENFRNDIRCQQDIFLRLYITINNYYELMVLPKHRHKLSTDDTKRLLDRATHEDNIMLAKAQQMLQDNTVEMKTNRRGHIKVLKIKLLDNTIRDLPLNQLKQSSNNCSLLLIHILSHYAEFSTSKLISL